VDLFPPRGKLGKVKTAQVQDVGHPALQFGHLGDRDACRDTIAVIQVDLLDIFQFIDAYIF
jgi:hypothetical protein